VTQGEAIQFILSEEGAIDALHVLYDMAKKQGYVAGMIATNMGVLAIQNHKRLLDATDSGIVTLYKQNGQLHGVAGSAIPAWKKENAE
jgi:hypothetical protein